jgi:hypothetical protein
MQKNVVRIEFTIADKDYHFMCDADSPLEHVKEALFQCQKYIGMIEDNIKAAQAAQAPAPIAEPIVEEPQPAE